MKRLFLSAALATAWLACEPSEWRPPQTEDSHEDPAKVRPGFGNAELHTWWPLTEPEVAALQGAERARQGDAHALLAFAIMGSGDRRDAESYARYLQRFDAFITAAHTTVDGASDDSKRGEALNRAMHETFFTGVANKIDPTIGAYDFDQPRLTQIFEQGKFNCISSALLYTAIARAFSLPVRGVMTEQHAFVDFGPESGTRVDVETTSKNGFGEVHDEKFYRDAAVLWKKMDLKPMTLDDYKKREIVPPYVFVARAMNDKRIMNDDTKGRLHEAAAMLAPDDADSVRNRMASYVNESKWLYEHKAFRTTLRLIEIVGPAVSDVPNRFSQNDALMRDVAWMAWYDANALLVTGKGDDAVAIANDGLEHIRPTWDDRKMLEGDFVNILANRMTELQVAADYENSLAAVTKHIDACRANDTCLNNLYLTFDGWDVKYQLAKDWENAKKVMKQCIALLPDDTRCHHTLEGLTSLHP